MKSKMPHLAPLGECAMTGKQQFAHRDAAKLAKALRRRDHDTWQAYRCGDCGRWHLGHQMLRRAS